MTIFIRTIILYICVVTAMRVMGKRQLGELQPSEFVIALMISELASIPISEKDIPLYHGIIPIAALVLLELVFSLLVIKSELMRKIITGSPVQIIKDGKLIMKDLKRLRICIDDVLEQLRLAGYSTLSEIDSAIIETNGQLSIVPKESSRPVVCSDLNLSPKQTHIPHTIIADGVLRRKNLEGAGLSENWLRKKLGEYNIKSYRQVAFFSVTDKKEITIQISEK